MKLMLGMGPACLPSYHSCLGHENACVSLCEYRPSWCGRGLRVVSRGPLLVHHDQTFFVKVA